LSPARDPRCVNGVWPAGTATHRAKSIQFNALRASPLVDTVGST
jgi:hypothetical protein